MSKVISLGMFAGGSWGYPGHPHDVYEYFSIDTDVAAAQPCIADRSVVFRSREAAERRLREITEQRVQSRLSAPPAYLRGLTPAQQAARLCSAGCEIDMIRVSVGGRHYNVHRGQYNRLTAAMDRNGAMSAFEHAVRLGIV